MPATKEIVASTLIGAAVVIGILALMRSRAQAKTAADEVEARRLLAERKAEAATAARELELKRQKEESAAREAQALKDSAVTKKEELQKKQAAADKAAAAEKAEAGRASAAEKAASLKSAFRPHAPVQISFGSQTGNAKAIAQELYETLTEQGVSCNLSDLNAWKQWSPALEETELGIFVMSTTGNGDPCDNMDKFHRFLKRKSHAEGELGLMRHLSFSVLALGDTNYDKFCEMGRWMDERLKVLGATPFLPVAMADEATGLEDVVEPWVEAVQKALFSKLSVDGNGATGEGEKEETKQNTSPPPPAAVIAAVATATAGSEACVSGPATDTTPPPPSPSPSPSSSFLAPTKYVSLLLTSRGVRGFDESVGTNSEILQLQTSPNLLHRPAAAVVVSGGEGDGGGHVVSSCSSVSFSSPLYGVAYGAAAETMTAQANAAAATAAAKENDEDDDDANGGALSFKAKVVGARYLTKGGAEAGRRVIHAELLPQNKNKNESKNEVKAREEKEGRGGGWGPSYYSVGDALGLKCPNHPEDVACVLAALSRARTGTGDDRDVNEEEELLASTKVALFLSKSKALVPLVASAGEEEEGEGGVSPTMAAPSLVSVLSWGLDLMGPVKPQLCATLALCCVDPGDRAKMSALAVKPGKVAWCVGGDGKSTPFEAFVSGQALRVAELLEAFPSCSPDLGVLFAALPPLASRFYSLASSPLPAASSPGKAAAPPSMAVAFSVVEYCPHTPSGNPTGVEAKANGGAVALKRQGLCTSWLEQSLMKSTTTAGEAAQGQQVGVEVEVLCSLKRASDFTLPQDSKTPVVMVGPGTGVAPFVGFIQHRQRQRASAFASASGAKADAAALHTQAADLRAKANEQAAAAKALTEASSAAAAAALTADSAAAATATTTTTPPKPKPKQTKTKRGKREKVVDTPKKGTQPASALLASKGPPSEEPATLTESLSLPSLSLLAQNASAVALADAAAAALAVESSSSAEAFAVEALRAAEKAVERAAKELEEAECGFGSMHLYFGCRHRDQDWLYEEELKAALEDGTLTSLRCAFSREQAEKVYVQHRLVEDAPLIQQILLGAPSPNTTTTTPATCSGGGGALFVCGDGMAMAKDVHKALLQCLLTPTSTADSALTAEGAEAVLESLKEQGRYVQDIWT